MQFKLGALLSVTTGINLTSFGDTCALMDFMASDSLTDMGRVMMQPRCAAALLTQFPALAQAAAPENIVNTHQEWLAAQVARFGNAFDVRPLAETPAAA